MKRSSGVLLHITSLPGRYGVGTLGNHARRFADFCHQAGLSWWQILPVGPAGNGNSPYQSDSVFAGNPDLIDLEQLIEWGLLKREECDRLDWGSHADEVCFEKLHRNQPQLLRLAFARAKQDSALWEQVQRFVAEQDWLDDYALYLALKQQMGGKPWQQWDAPLAKRDRQTLKLWKERLQEEMEYHCWVQYLFFEQWAKLKEYCNRKGVRLIGDIPIYVALDSADAWAEPQLFQFDEELNPVAVAGCPPDAFSATGQLWGNPLYRWEYHRQTGYAWWIRRIAQCLNLYDCIRIDHFRGFDEYYSIPAGDETAEHGHWEPGPSMSLMQALKDALGNVNVIAEDLGFLTDGVRRLLYDSGFPGMKVIQFAFDSREESDYLPHNYEKNCVVYTGTHDNDTLCGWYKVLDPEDLKLSQKYMNNANTPKRQIHWDFIRLALASVADLCIIPLQDYLGLGSEARINTPSTLGNNWRWRMKQGCLTKELADQIRELTTLYGR